MILISLVIAETIVCLAMGAVFLGAGQWRLGVAQVLIAAVTLVLYTGRMT